MHNGLLNFFKRFRRDERELAQFFKELFPELKPIEYVNHPSDEVLQDYLAGRLSNQWRLDDPQMVERLMQGELNDWQRTEVSAHLLTCEPCSQKLSEWRAAEPAQLEAAEKPRRALRWAFRLALLAAVGALVFLLVIVLKPSEPSIGSGQPPPCESRECSGAGPG